MFFCLVVRGVYPPYTLSGPTTKKPLFLFVFSLMKALAGRMALYFVFMALDPKFLGADFKNNQTTKQLNKSI